MAQADGVVANASGAAVRSDLNAQLLAIITNNSGTTAPTTTRAYQFWYDETTNQLKLRNSANDAWIVLRTIASGSDPVVDITNGSATATAIRPEGDPDSGFFFHKDATNNHHGFSYSVGGTEWLRLDSSGPAQANPSFRWLVTATDDNIGTYTGGGPSRNGFILTKAGKFEVCQDGGFGGAMNRADSAGGEILVFFCAGVNKGNIGVTSSGVSYNTGSDYRLKENVVALTGAKARVNQLDVKRFNFIGTPDKTVDGFIAHEAQEIVPEAVTGTKDEANDDGTPKYQGIDQSKIVPLLTAALQEAFAEIAALTTRIETLEAG
tara:strand:+ start:1392 stop:2354 length:963 start_codon:yes stop_codon:yes gene_type:complete